MKGILNTALLTLLSAALLGSCSETEVAQEFDNWEAANNEYLAGIEAKCAQYAEKGVTLSNASEGEMFSILSYLLDPECQDYGTLDYIYCEVIARGEGTQSPHYTDSIWIDYRTRLIPSATYPEGKILDQSYRTESIDRSSNIPYPFVTSNLVSGVSTAIMHMVPGDIWRLYIPYTQAYGKEETTNVPGYSTLVFDVCLEKFKLTYVD